MKIHRKILRSVGWWIASGALDRAAEDRRFKRFFTAEHIGTPPVTEGLPTSFSPLLHYHSTFDAIKVIRSHAAPHVAPDPNHLTNYLGVRINPFFFPGLLDGRQGEVEGIPIPGNWHADIAEFAAALRAVDLSTGSFTMAELGCGWGCWMNNTGVAARRLGREVRLIGVEGDEGHVDFAYESLATNGFEPVQYRIERGVAAASAGYALFPRQDKPGVGWGSEPIFDATPEQRKRSLEAGTCDELRMVPLSEIIGDNQRLDLLHVDIQGGEANFVAKSIKLLSEKVAYLLIGTHSRQIEGRLFASLLEEGWLLEIERPAILSLGTTPVVTIDGVQGWRNTRLIPI